MAFASATNLSPRRVLVTGADGMLGADLCAALAASGFDVTPSTVEDMDVRLSDRVGERLRRARPNVVIHAAAYTNVDGAEEQRDLCYAINADGTANIAAACRETGAQMIFISTDYVFDGRATTPYVESSPVNPLNVYGASKLAGERRVAAICPAYKIVRVAGLQGVHCWKFNKNFIEKILAAAKTRPALRVVNDQRGSPTFAFDVAEKMIGLIGVEATGVFHLTNEGECSWFEFAREALREAGVENVEVQPATAAEFGAKAPRPAYWTLDNARLREMGLPPMPHWRDSLTEYFRRRAEEDAIQIQ